MQPRLFLWMYMSQTFMLMHNYDETGTFKIDCIFVFGSNSFSMECMGYFYASIKITIFKTLRRLDTTWNFAHSITRVSTHEHERWEHCVHSLLKRVFKQLTLTVACSAPSRHGSPDICDSVELCVYWVCVIKRPMHFHWKLVWAENDNTVNLKSASFIVTMLLHEGLTHIHSQKKA